MLRSLLRLSAGLLLITLALISGALAVGAWRGGAVLAYAATLGQTSQLFLLDVSHSLNLPLIAPSRQHIGHASLSPDGRRIAYIHNGSALHVLDTYTRQITRVSGDSGTLMYPSWAPDSRQLVYSARGMDSGWHIYTTREGDDGRWGSIFNLTRGQGNSYAPRWSPDGQWVAFSGDRIGDIDISLYLMRPDGSQQRRLGERLRVVDNSPAWSPDGSRLLLTMALQTGDAALYVLTLADGALHRLPATEDGWNPSWSPDGQRIVFVRGWSSLDNTDLYLLTWTAPDYSDARAERLTYKPGTFKSSPNWKP